MARPRPFRSSHSRPLLAASSATPKNSRSCDLSTCTKVANESRITAGNNTAEFIPPHHAFAQRQASRITPLDPPGRLHIADHTALRVVLHISIHPPSTQAAELRTVSASCAVEIEEAPTTALDRQRDRDPRYDRTLFGWLSRNQSTGVATFRRGKSPGGTGHPRNVASRCQ